MNWNEIYILLRFKIVDVLAMDLDKHLFRFVAKTLIILRQREYIAIDNERLSQMDK